MGTTTYDKLLNEILYDPETTKNFLQILERKNIYNSKLANALINHGDKKSIRDDVKNYLSGMNKNLLLKHASTKDFNYVDFPEYVNLVKLNIEYGSSEQELNSLLNLNSFKEACNKIEFVNSVKDIFSNAIKNNNLKVLETLTSNLDFEKSHLKNAALEVMQSAIASQRKSAIEVLRKNIPNIDFNVLNYDNKSQNNNQENTNNVPRSQPGIIDRFLNMLSPVLNFEGIKSFIGKFFLSSQLQNNHDNFDKTVPKHDPSNSLPNKADHIPYSKKNVNSKER